MKYLTFAAGVLTATSAFAETPILTVYAGDYFTSEWGPGPVIEKGFEVRVQEDAGANSSYKNSDYSKAGASIRTKDDLLKNADIVIKINPFDNKE